VSYPDVAPLTALGGTVTGALTVNGALSTGSHLSGTSTGLAAAAGANAGGTPPAPVIVASSSDTAGNITFGTGTTPAAGAMVAVTFGTSYGANPPGVSIVAANAATQALGLYLSALTGGGFTVSAANAPSASQANTTYAFSFMAIGG
jgi:hypothetical protein